MNNFIELINYLDSGIGIVYFALIYIIAVVLILPGSWLSLLGGFLYGPFLGTLIVFSCAFLGATISFLLSKKLFALKVQNILKDFPQVFLLEKILKKGGLKLIILTRLSPIFPFSLLNYFYGLNKVSYKDFAISLFCILPGSYLYCSLGGIANNLNEIQNLKTNDNLIVNIVSIISTSLVIFFLGKYANEVIQGASDD